MSNRNRESNVTTDRETIRNWADERDVVPAHNPDRDDERQYDLFQDDGVPEEYEERNWNEFFEEFESDDRALVYRTERTDEELGEYEIADRNEAVARATVDDAEIEERLLEGETVTTEVTETTVVEREIVETEIIETEAVGSEVVRGRITGAELVDWEVTDTDFNVDLHGEGTVEQSYDVSGDGVHGEGMTQEGESSESQTETGRINYDALDLNLDATVDGTFTVEIEETWRVRREEDERIIIESRLEDVDIEEHDEIAEDESMTDVNVEGLQRGIVESDALAADVNENQVVGGNVMETTRTEADVLESQLIQRRMYEDTLARRRRLHLDVTDEELLDVELSDTETHGADVVDIEYDEEAETVVMADAVEGERTEIGGMDEDERTETRAMDEEERTGMGTMDDERIESEVLSENDVGKPVIDEDGNKVGTVTDVQGDDLLVDPETGMMERIEVALGWHDEGEDYRIDDEQVRGIDDDKVVIEAIPMEDSDERR